ncbi:MAG: hypothetical protein DSZ29_02185 [Aquificaceae bacterium]|nr:MAG: hypothetical protein DSZ29_02185 [Aquificaceae bacterium]
MTRFSCFLLSLLFLATVAFAEQDLTPQNFSFKAPLAGGESSLRQVDLPNAILQGMMRNDLGDLRVFNAAGQIVPHTFVRGVTQKTSQDRPLVFYPFDKEQSANPASIRIHIEQKGIQQRVDVQSQKASQDAKKQNEFQYIIENTLSQNNANQQLCRLDLDWQQPKDSMVLPLKIESSRDLQHWSLLSSRKTVSKLNYAGSQLLRSYIDIPCTTQRYLRLQWLKPEQNIKLIKITGRYRQAGSKKMQWDNLGKPQVNNQGEWLFENKSVAPIARLSLNAPSNGVLYKGQLFSRATKKSKWRRQQSIIQYRLKMGESELKSDAVELYNGGDKYWKIKLSGETKFSESQLPDINVSRQQQQIIYLAQGAEPFTLVYGNSEVKPASDSGITQLIRTLTETGSNPDIATIADIVKITDKVEVAQKTPWKIIALWLVLLLGTAVMGYMAYSLYRQMNSKD